MAEAESPGMREVILQEAGRLFVTSGYSGLSMREIAEASGVSRLACTITSETKKPSSWPS